VRDIDAALFVGDAPPQDDDMSRAPVVGVMGGSESDIETTQIAFELGKRIAESGWVLLNGGRDSGVMAASARGAKSAGGWVVGILPDSHTRDASPDVDLAIATGLGHARNTVNVLSCDVVIACLGGAGTLSEVAFAAINGKRTILLNFDPGPSLREFFDSGLVTSAKTVDDAIAQASAAITSARGA
jgi:uncharacterized protein (TIGR00725 family)